MVILGEFESPTPCLKGRYSTAELQDHLLFHTISMNKDIYSGFFVKCFFHFEVIFFFDKYELSKIKPSTEGIHAVSNLVRRPDRKVNKDTILIK